ncbi:hypothetical protein XYCOK13_02160 [Xylanibacillus composti]|uniref:Transposase zinc-ribbon domain-containing protein n=1 Tax=Xylanibacillus composti TaxID=1572762 RepID=A0A8J4H0X1_9BACL|nr:transposase [Xylanibacillus composti]GIQ67392.1 hypothetical protein XYCOK13_02160 [Xylanibacillus composti]
MSLVRAGFKNDSYSYFLQLRWPEGFRCPRCGYNQAYSLRTRQLPLYQCRACRFQTSLTAGTILEGSRTSLDKWRTAIEWVSTASSINATQLKDMIQVTYKTAWRMLHKIRSAISMLDASCMQTGQVRAGMAFYGRPLFTYQQTPHEHPVWVSVSEEQTVSKQGSHDHNSRVYVKIKCVQNNELCGEKLNNQGKKRMADTHMAATANINFLSKWEFAKDPLLKQIFVDAKEWINRTFKGIGGKHLQSYWDEYCFRVNYAHNELPLNHRLACVCISRC